MTTGFPPDVVSRLELLAGFRNIVVHEYVSIDPKRVIEALDKLDPVADQDRRHGILVESSHFMNLSPGSRLGRYEVRALLGAGGMGEVYLAWDHDLEREVAVKVLRGGAEDGGRVRRFMQEAKAVSGLHHPNIAHVYEIGLRDDLHFIAMERVEGETLRRRLGGGAMAIEEVLEIGTQIAGALAAAHKHGVIHRDIKPENVIITPDGYAKVLDFGLAKLREIRGDDAATLLKTSTGVAMGTLGYMAPEQLVGGDVTPAADIFSLGVVLYEMLAGRKPFDGAISTDIVSAVLTKTPRPLHEIRSGIPPRLERVVGKALSKDVEERYGDGREVYEQLREISREGDQRWQATAGADRWRATTLRGVAAAVVVAMIAGGAWMFVRTGREREAGGKIAVAEALMQERKLAEAYETALAAAAVLPNEVRLQDVIARTSARLSIESNPEGATVFLQRIKGPAERVRVGVTPLTIPRIARADYLMTLEKEGYAPGVRPITTMPAYIRGEMIAIPTVPVRMKLGEAAKVPPGMVFVEGGPYRLSTYYRPSDRVVELRDFFIDRHEVTNREFEGFIRDGGYRRRELWKHPFVDEGKTLSFDEAMSRFRDTTGLPGPRSWSGGTAPRGRNDHPVTDVTWYEAAAFAEWKGKKLPTIYQWEKASRLPAVAGSAFPWGVVREGVDATERANFQGKGTVSVHAMPSGLSPWGASHMAGNVSEWCRNPHPPGYAARGGSWQDAVYAFGRTAALPAFFSAPTLGFRCASGGGGEEGDFALNPSGFVPVYEPVDDRTFEEFRRRYEYRREPLNARVIESAETPDWRREKITYVAAGKTVPAYLYLPKGFRRPLQVIHFAPAGDVVSGYATLPHSIEIALAPLIRGGRAVFAVELEGFLGRPRPPDWVVPDPAQEEWVDYNVSRVTEMRRGLDYIETRQDLDHSRVALVGVSAGGGPGVFVTALEPRYRSVAFAATGIKPREREFAPAANRIHFVPRIHAPKLMLHGRYDEDTSLKSDAEPMFRLLSEPKRLELYDGGHIPPLEISIPTIRKWLDETMGPVAQ